MLAQLVRNLPTNAGDIKDTGSIPRLGRSPGGGDGNSSSILAWEIPWTEEPGGLQSMGLQRVGYDLVTNHYHQEPQNVTLSGKQVFATS